MSKKTTNQQPQEEEQQPQARIEELEEQLMRVHADYQNYRRRTQQQQEQQRKQAAQKLIKEILAAVDNLELALSQASKDDGLYKGVELVLGQLISTLEDHGVKKIPTDTFNPQYHEAIMSAYADQPQGEIIEVLQQGYMLAENPLRTAKVKVSKGPKPQGEQDNE